MPRVQASILLPYRLNLESGLYPTGLPGQDLGIHEVGPRMGKTSTMAPVLVGPVSGSLLPSFRRPRTMVSLTEDLRDTEIPDEQNELNARLAVRLLHQANRLLRSYRAITRNATITELSRAAASPFRFAVVPGAGSPIAWRPELVFQASPPKAPAQPTQSDHRASSRPHGLGQ